MYPIGVPKVRSSDLKKKSFTFNNNNILVSDDRSFIYLLLKPEICKIPSIKKQLEKEVKPHYGSLKHDFDGCSHFLEKTRDIFV